METRMARLEERPVGRGRLWFGALGASAAWFLHISARYALVPVACVGGVVFVLHVVTLVCGTVAVLSAIVAWGNVNRARGIERSRGGSAATRRTAFLGGLGVMLAGIFLLLIVAEFLPTWFQDPCLGLPGPVVGVGSGGRACSG